MSIFNFSYLLLLVIKHDRAGLLSALRYSIFVFKKAQTHRLEHGLAEPAKERTAQDNIDAELLRISRAVSSEDVLARFEEEKKLSKSTIKTA